MRAHSTIDRTFASEYDSTPCPTWMKTLEDKYKRLHLKIVFDNSSLRGNTRPSGATSTILGGRRQTEKHVRLSKRLRDTSRRVPESTREQQQTADRKDVIIQDAFEKEISDKGSASQCERTLDELSEEKSDKISEKDSLSDMEYSKRTVRSDVHTKKKAKSLFHKNGDIKKSSRHIRSDTTKTVKSCPPAIKLQKGALPTSHGDNVTETGRLPRNKTSKLFQKMSKEAQIAINETLSEKKKDRTAMIRENSIKFNNYTNTMRTSRTDTFGNLPQDLPGKPRRGRARSCDARRSISSDTSSSTSGFSYTKLPNISDSRRDMTSRELRKQNVLLPGVGRYQIPVAREQTFQITGAEYDIRYREVINCERRESISPPSDILDQAMMKCQEWLTKYAVFAKR